MAFDRVNGVEYARAASIAGTFTAVVFDPGHLSLVKGSPDGRRRFLDAALCQLYPGYLSLLRKYTRLVTQKNALLKNYYATFGGAELLDIFDEKLSEAGQQVSEKRRAYLELLAPLVRENYRDISQGREEMEICYLPSYDSRGLACKLKETRSRDIAAGFCTAGPHREDFDIILSGKQAKLFASQGQQRSAVLSLKLAEAAAAQSITGQHPVMLLDDVLSELDDMRQSYLLSRMEQRQTIVTACDAGLFCKTDGKVLYVKQGTVSHLGQDTILRTKEILGIFDLDTATLSKHTRDFLARAEKEGRVVNVTGELPKSFIVTQGQASGVYITQISAATLKKRSGARRQLMEL